MQKKACFARSKLVRSAIPTDRSLCFSLKQHTVELLKAGGEFALRAMKRSMNFSSIFRSKEEDQAPPPGPCGARPAAPRTLTQIGPERSRAGEFRIAVRELGVVSGHITIPDEVHQHGDKKDLLLLRVNETFGLVIAFQQKLGLVGILYNARAVPWLWDKS
jgi:hypothetical protein